MDGSALQPRAPSTGSDTSACTKLALCPNVASCKISYLGSTRRLAHLLLAASNGGNSMTARPTPAPGPSDNTTPPRSVTRADVIDAAARVITRRGDHRMRWAAIAYEAGNAQAVMASQWFEDLAALIDECYSRTSQGLSDSLLRAETAPGTALDKLAAFLVAALEIRRARGAFLSFRRGGDLPQPLQRRLHEHDTTVRMRLKRLLNKV